MEVKKVPCCEEQYCIGIWNVRFMNQGKPKVVKQEMARVNVNILGISELKWTGMGDSHVVPGKSDLHARGEGERVIFSSHGRGIGPQDA